MECEIKDCKNNATEKIKFVSQINETTKYMGNILICKQCKDKIINLTSKISIGGKGE